MERLPSQRSQAQDLFFDIATVALTHLREARAASSSLTKSERQVLLPAFFLDRYLADLERVDFDVCHPWLRRKTNALDVAKLWWSSVRGHV